MVENVFRTRRRGEKSSITKVNWEEIQLKVEMSKTWEDCKASQWMGDNMCVDQQWLSIVDYTIQTAESRHCV